MKLIVVDIQNGIMDNRLYNFDVFIKSVTRIIDAARKNGVEVIYIQHDDGPGTGLSVGNEGFEIAEQVSPKENEKKYIKTINSCFGNSEFADYLNRSGDKDIIIVGLQTNFCIDASVKSAFERGYNVIVPGEANTTFDNDYMDGQTTYKYYNDMMWPERFAKCISVDAVIKMMER